MVNEREIIRSSAVQVLTYREEEGMVPYPQPHRFPTAPAGLSTQSLCTGWSGGESYGQQVIYIAA